MSYGIFLGKVKDHFVEPYANHIEHITGRGIVAEELGLVKKTEDGKLEPMQAAQVDHDGDGIPSAAPKAGHPHAGGGAHGGAGVGAGGSYNDDGTGCNRIG